MQSAMDACSSSAAESKVARVVAEKESTGRHVLLRVSSDHGGRSDHQSETSAGPYTAHTCALRGSGTDAHPAGSTLGALRPPGAAGQVLRSDCRARAVARICCGVTYRRRAIPRSATRIASVA